MQFVDTRVVLWILNHRKIQLCVNVSAKSA